MFVTASLARGMWQCGASNRLASITASERLLVVDDRRGVSTTGDSVFVMLSSGIDGSPPDARRPESMDRPLMHVSFGRKWTAECHGKPDQQLSVDM